jgi:hypothetical protein
MKIQITRDARSGKTPIPKGDYWVSLNSDSAEMNLAGGGKDIRIPAKRRRAKVNNKTTQVSFYSGGGPIWSLVVIAPKYGEWVAFVEFTSMT